MRKETLRLDFNADFRSLRHANLFVTAKNVFDEPDAFYREDNPAKLYRYNTTGAYLDDRGEGDVLTERRLPAAEGFSA